MHYAIRKHKHRAGVQSPALGDRLHQLGRPADRTVEPAPGQSSSGPMAREAPPAPAHPVWRLSQGVGTLILMPTLLEQLEAINHATPTARKVLLAPDLNAGRDLLTALALRTGGWVGWEIMTLRGLATELARLGLHRRGTRVARDLEITSLIESVMDDLAALGRLSPGFTHLAGGLGFRRAVRDAVLELRVAGTNAELLEQAAPSTAASDLALILARYREQLEGRHQVDAGGLFEQALAAFQQEVPFILSGQVYVTPGLADRGLPGRLLARMAEWGAVRLADPVESVTRADPPPGAAFTLFMAATPTDEIREVLRRIRGENLRWDEVEIVATDPDTYGTALDAIACRAGIPITYLAGLPLARSRLGRIVRRWFDWIEQGLPDRLLREAIETGDLAPLGEPPSPQLVRLLRTLAIGWSRDRYHRALDDLRRGITRQRDQEYPEEERTDTEWKDATRQFQSLVEAIIASTPPGPEPGRGEPAPVAPARLAESLQWWITQTPVENEAEEHGRGRLVSRLDLFVREMEMPRPFGLALAHLREAIADFRVWPTLGPGRHPWNMNGGHLHLTDLAHAGTTGRRRVFVLGLDAERVSGPRVQDPLLPDAARGRIGPDLATTADRREQREVLVRRALASLRGEVTLSWAFAAAGGRDASPAPVVLEIARHTLKTPALSFEDLRKGLSLPASAAPTKPSVTLDARDIWLGAIASGPILLDGTSQVLERWPALRRGVSLAHAWLAGDITAAHGLVPDAASEDPRRRGVPISASSLQLLAACPLAWLYRHAMRLRPLEDAVFDPGIWLSPLDRGSLLHSVYERFAREWMRRQDQLHAAEAEESVVSIARQVFAEWERRVPAPSAAAVQAEWECVEQSARSFLLMERDTRGSSWVECEVELVAKGRRPQLRLPDGSQLAVWGRIDRIDRRQDGSLIVIDFKTGSTYGYAAGGKGGPFRGGRQLQSGLYALATEQLFDARVAAFEYRFPTARGENHVTRHDRALLDRAADTILDLLGQIERGEFLPTMEPNDCGFCDFRDICRVRDGGFGKVQSPRAEWAKEIGESEPRYRPMRRRRGEEQA